MYDKIKKTYVSPFLKIKKKGKIHMENKKKTAFDILNEAAEGARKMFPGYNGNLWLSQPNKVTSTNELFKKEDKLTPEDEAAFLEGFNSIYEDDTPGVPSASNKNTVNTVKTSNARDMASGSVQNQKGDPNQSLVLQKLPSRQGNEQNKIVTYSNSASQSDIDKIKAASKGIDWTKATLNGVLGVSNNIPDEMLQYRAPSITPSDFVNMKKEESKSGKAMSQSQLSANENVPVAYFREAPAWTSPAKETNDPIEKAARNYAKELIDKQYVRRHEMWYRPYDASSPYGESDLKGLKAVYDNALQNAKQPVGLLQAITKGLDIAAEYKNWGDYQAPFLMKLGSAILMNEKSGIPGIFDTFDYEALVNNNKSLQKAKTNYDKLNNSEYKYLINDKDYRDAFIEGIYEEIEKIKNTNSFGYNSQDEDERFKEALIQQLMRIIHINSNYDNEKANRDELMNS